MVLGDPTRLRQVLFNLVGNAVKFTDRGHVTVRAGQLRQPDGAAVLRFEVDDSGIGIDAEAQARLFERFSQADGSTARRYGGTGLGLAISRELVSLMGGEIGVESAPGQGSRFWFTVPCRPAIAEPRAPSALPAAPAARPARILVVEDNDVNQLLVVRMLAKGGHEVEVARDGGEAIARLEARPSTSC